jgi:putative oxidoreductase
MKYIPNIVGALLGLLFLAASIPVLLHLMPEQKLPEGPMATFMGLLGGSGYMTFVKVCELIGGILVMIPRTRNFGLLVLGPIIVNILAFWAFIAKAVPNGLTIAAVVFAAYLLWCGRKAFAGLLNQ